MGEAMEIDGKILFLSLFSHVFLQGHHDEWVQVPPKKNLTPSLSTIVNVKSSNIQDEIGNRISLQLLAKENLSAKEKFQWEQISFSLQKELFCFHYYAF